VKDPRLPAAQERSKGIEQFVLVKTVKRGGAAHVHIRQIFAGSSLGQKSRRHAAAVAVNNIELDLRKILLKLGEDLRMVRAQRGVDLKLAFLLRRMTGFFPVRLPGRFFRPGAFLYQE